MASALTPFIVSSLSTTGSATTGALTASSVSTPALIARLATASAGINLPGNKTINFGSDQTEATNAGSIGYQLGTAGALDVYGSGTTEGGRVFKLWDNITIPGTLTVAGIVTKQIPWTNMVLNSAIATNYGGGFGIAQYCKDALGFVWLRGLINVSATGTLTTLPSSCWPKSGNAATNYLIAGAIGPNQTVKEIQVFFPNGNINVVPAGAYWCTLDNISWDTSVT